MGLKGKAKTITDWDLMSETWKEGTGFDTYGRDSMKAVNKLKPFIERVKTAALQSKTSEERESKEENGA